MGMGTYKPNYRYRQESPSAYSGAIVDLMKLKQQQYGGAIDSLDKLGQANKRNEISALMGTDEYMNADPATAQALIAAMSGGRDLGENFAKTIKMSDNNKGDIQGNEWDETAATTLFGRQMTKQAANNAASMARQVAGDNAAMSRTKANDTSKGLLYGKSGDTAKKIEEITTELDNLDSRAELAKLDPNNEMNTEDFKKTKRDLNVRLQLLLASSSLNAGAQGSVSKSLMEVDTGSLKSTTKKLTPGIRAMTTDMQQKAYDAGSITWGGQNIGWVFPDGEKATDTNIMARVRARDGK